MIRFLVFGLLLVHVVATETVFAGKSGLENRDAHLDDETTANGSRALAIVGIKPYKGEVDDISDDSPTIFNATMHCEATDDPSTRYKTPGIDYSPENWDLYRLNLQSNYCYTIKVNRFDCDMIPKLLLYKGVANAANSPFSTRDEALVEASPLASPGGDWYVHKDSKYCADNTDPWHRSAPIVDSGNYTLAVYYERSIVQCSGSYNYEVSIEKEDCSVGEVTYDGKIDVKEGVTTIGAYARCEETIPELRSLWQLNLEADRCYSFLASGGCDFAQVDFSLYDGIATDANGTGATLVEEETSFSSSIYCGYYLSMEMKFKTTEMDANEAPFTLAIQKNGGGCRFSEGATVRIESEICKGLLKGCTNNTECASKICTGRPGKPKKCRFCARKQETCSRSEDCCQSRKFPNRYCNNGQCKKRSSPVILAYSSWAYGSKEGSASGTNYYLIDMTTWETTRLKSLSSDSYSSPGSTGDQELGDSTSLMEYDPKTRILWTYGYTQTLTKRDAFFNKIEAFSLESSLVAMEIVEGELYAILRDEEDVLVTINQTDGVVTTVGPITDSNGSQRISGLAYDGKRLYAVATITSRQLVTIDMETGNITSSVPTDLYKYESLEFGPDGKLYGFWSQGSFDTVDKATGIRESGKTLGRDMWHYFTIAS